jgi:DNA primase
VKTSLALHDHFVSLLEKYVSRLAIRGNKASGLCPLHPDRSPSFSADVEKLVWFCFACAHGGGVKDFALSVGEGWNEVHSQKSLRERRRFAVQTRKRQAEQQARIILERRQEALRRALCFKNHEAIRDANEAAELLALFHRRPDLAREFPELVTRTECEYSEALFKQTILEAQLAGEVECG